MKKIALLLLLLTASLSSAQDWVTDLQKAKELAAKEDKTIVLVFQGSDWCAPCMKLDREIWSTDTFKKYASEHFIMLQADFPRRKKNALSKEQQEKNNALAEKYNKNGFFPFVVLLDQNGNVLGEAGYEKTTPENYIKKLTSLIQ